MYLLLTFVDGFHTSASDPELQKKYGHTRNVIDIAPPPTFSSLTPPEGAPNQYNMYSSQYVPNGGPASSGSAPPAYNRYVAYDPYAPSQQQQSSVQQNGQQQPLGQHQPQQQPPKQTPSIAVLGFSMPSMSFARSSSYGLPIAQSQSKSFPSTSSHTQASEFPYSQGHEVSGSKHLSENGGSALQMNHSAFDPIADSDVEILDSHSSSVL